MFYNISLGVFPYSLSEDFARAMNVDKSRARVLLQTESARVRSMAEIESYKQMAVSKYQIIATLDDRTSDICQSMDLKVFDTKDYEVGVTAPPFHPNCRSTKAPYYEDSPVTKDGRIARGESNKNVYVPSDMTYKQYKEKFIKKEVENNEINAIYGYAKFSKKIFSHLRSYYNDLEEMIVQLRNERIEHIMDRHPEVVQLIKKEFKKIINNPDYIFKDKKHDDTIWICKKSKKKSGLMLVIKLKLGEHNSNFKNSIITGRKTDIERYVKSNKGLLIYKKNDVWFDYYRNMW